MSQVVGKVGFFHKYVVSSFMLFMGLVFVGFSAQYLLVSASASRTDGLLIGGLGIAFGLLGLLTGINSYREYLRITPDQMESLDALGRPKITRIDQVGEIDMILDTQYGGYHIGFRMLPNSGSSGGTVNSRRLTNRQKVERAFIEAVWLKNPSIVIDSRILEKFGNPPYGIFGSK